MKRVYFGWIVVASSLLIGTAAFGARYSFGVFFKALQDEFGLSRALTSWVFSLHMLFSLVVAVFGGWALDRYGPRLILLVTGFATGLSLLLTSRVTSAWQLYFTYSLLLALGTGATFAILSATVSRWFATRRGLALGIATSGSSLAVLVMAPVAASLILNYGWRTASIWLAVIIWVVILSSALLLKKEPGEVAEPRSNGLSSTAKTSVGDSAARQVLPLEALKSRNFWLLMLAYLAYAFCLHLVLTHIVRHAIDLGSSPLSAGAMLSFLGGISILGRLVGGRASDRMGRKSVTIVCGFVQAVAMLWLVAAGNLWALYLFALAYGLAYGGFETATTALVSETFGLRSLGTIIGIMSIAWGTGAAIGPTLAGYIFDNTGSYSVAFSTGALAMSVSAASFFFLKAAEKPHSNSSLRTI